MKVVRFSALCAGHLYPQEIFLALISVGDWVNRRAIVRPEGLRQWKNPGTPSGFEPATFRHVTQCFNQVRHRLPQFFIIMNLNKIGTQGNKVYFFIRYNFGVGEGCCFGIADKSAVWLSLSDPWMRISVAKVQNVSKVLARKQQTHTHIHTRTRAHAVVL